MANRAPDWLAQARRDLEQAEASRRDGRHEWACFAAHQCAEKAVKALNGDFHARAILDFVAPQMA
jgi:HEPN domain-containing protein